MTHSITALAALTGGKAVTAAAAQRAWEDGLYAGTKVLSYGPVLLKIVNTVDFGVRVNPTLTMRVDGFILDVYFELPRERGSKLMDTCYVQYFYNHTKQQTKVTFSRRGKDGLSYIDAVGFQSLGYIVKDPVGRRAFASYVRSIFDRVRELTEFKAVTASELYANVKLFESNKRLRSLCASTQYGLADHLWDSAKGLIAHVLNIPVDEFDRKHALAARQVFVTALQAYNNTKLDPKLIPDVISHETYKAIAEEATRYLRLCTEAIVELSKLSGSETTASVSIPALSAWKKTRDGLVWENPTHGKPNHVFMVVIAKLEGEDNYIVRVHSVGTDAKPRQLAFLTKSMTLLSDKLARTVNDSVFLYGSEAEAYAALKAAVAGKLADKFKYMGDSVTSALNQSTTDVLLKELGKYCPPRPGTEWVVSKSSSGSQLVERELKGGGEHTAHATSLKGREFEIFLRAYIDGARRARKGA